MKMCGCPGSTPPSSESCRLPPRRGSSSTMCLPGLSIRSSRRSPERCPRRSARPTTRARRSGRSLCECRLLQEQWSRSPPRIAPRSVGPIRPSPWSARRASAMMKMTRVQTWKRARKRVRTLMDSTGSPRARGAPMPSAADAKSCSRALYSDNRMALLWYK